MKKLVYLLVLIITTSFSTKEEADIWFPGRVVILENCNSRTITTEFTIKTNSRKKIKLHSFELSDTEVAVRINGKEMHSTDIVDLKKKKPLTVKLEYKRARNKKQEEFTFKSDQKGFVENNIQIEYGSHYISHESVRSGKETVLSLTESCNDSIRVYFPYGGTFSGATLYKDSISFDTPYKSVSYGFGDPVNYIKLSKKDIGRYYVRYGACHWGNSFWLDIE